MGSKSTSSGFPDSDGAPELHHNNLVGDRPYQIQVVFDDYNRRTRLLGEVPYGLAEFFSFRDIQPSGWFVEEDDARLHEPTHVRWRRAFGLPKESSKGSLSRSSTRSRSQITSSERARKPSYVRARRGR